MVRGARVGVSVFMLIGCILSDCWLRRRKRKEIVV